MVAKKRKKRKSSAALWIVLFLLLTVILVLIYSPQLFHKDLLFGEEGIISVAARNTRKAEDFTEENGRIYYPGADMGIDVSEHQQEIDWEAVSRDGITFAIIRMGFRGSSDGDLHVDKCFYNNLNGAIAAGLDVGVYFYSQANCEAEAIEEAEYVLAAISGYQLQCPVFYDWEEGTPRSQRLDSVSIKDVADFSEAFCSTVENGDYQAGVYFNQKYGYGMSLSAMQKYSFWLAQFDDAMTFYFDTQYWQYTYQGTVDGISTAVDLDLRYNSEATNEENH